MGSLLNEVREQSSNKNKMLTVLNSLSEEDREDLLAALADESIGIIPIHKVLKARGIKVSADTLRRFRQR